jgi:hypothetical protein
MDRHWKRAGILLLLCFPSLLLGCAERRLASRPSRAPEATKSELHCDEVPGLVALLQPGSGLLLGEMHGTVESPEFAANAVCLALKTGVHVTLGLELPREDEERLGVFLRSPGTDRDRAAFLASPFWQKAYQDGRSCRSRLALLDKARGWSREGWPLHVILFDRMAQPSGSWQERDRWMAERIKEAMGARPGDLFIGLAGNVHMRLTRGTPWDAGYESAGFLLKDLEPGRQLTSLDVAYSGGSAWTCTSAEAASCKVRSLRGSGDDQGTRVIRFPEVRQGYDGVYNVGKLTASPPARTQALRSSNPS